MIHTFTRVFCAARNKQYMNIAIEYGFQPGARLPDNHVYALPYFVDQDWKNPNLEAYLSYVSKYRPYMATVLDWELPEQENEVMRWAEAVAPFVHEVIIIPKVSGSIASIPSFIAGKPVRLGFSVPTRHGATYVPLSEFAARPVHLLGGSPHAHLVYPEYLNVVSGDCNQFMLLASRGLVWSAEPVISARNKFAPTLREAGYGHVNQRINEFAFTLSLVRFDAAYRSGLYSVPKKLMKIVYGR